MVSVDVKHNVFFFTHLHTPFSPSLICLLISVDVKHHVYLLTCISLSPSLISLMSSVGVKHHVYSIPFPPPPLSPALIILKFLWMFSIMFKMIYPGRSRIEATAFACGDRAPCCFTSRCAARGSKSRLTAVVTSRACRAPCGFRLQA